MVVVLSTSIVSEGTARTDDKFGKMTIAVRALTVSEMQGNNKK
jgi:hypothetical protein